MRAARRRYPKRATFALIGFGIFAFGALIGMVWSASSSAIISGGNYDGYRLISILIGVRRLLTELGGIGMLLAALFTSEEIEQPQLAQPGAPYGYHPHSCRPPVGAPRHSVSHECG